MRFLVLHIIKHHKFYHTYIVLFNTSIQQLDMYIIACFIISYSFFSQHFYEFWSISISPIFFFIGFSFDISIISNHWCFHTFQCFWSLIVLCLVGQKVGKKKSETLCCHNSILKWLLVRRGSCFFFVSLCFFALGHLLYIVYILHVLLVGAFNIVMFFFFDR